MSGTMGYKMTHDSGFAPNPFHGVLTLATCKPKIRACRGAGDWVAGFASQTLVNNAARRGLKVQRDGLVYLMKIREVLPLHAYFEDNRFAAKQPPCPRKSSDPVALCGDNIYYRDQSGRYEQLENLNHHRDDTLHDTAGVNALVAERFYYFGRDCFVPEGGWAAITGTPLSKGRTFWCAEGFDEKLRRYFDEKGIAQGMHAAPALMNEGTPLLPKQVLDISVRGTRFAPSVWTSGRTSSGSCGS